MTKSKSVQIDTTIKNKHLKIAKIVIVKIHNSTKPNLDSYRVLETLQCQIYKIRCTHNLDVECSS